MNEHRLNALLVGETPSLDDIADFIAVVEKLQIDILWKILNSAPLLNGILQKAVNKTLQEKIVRKNVDDSLDAIITGMRQFLK